MNTRARILFAATALMLAGASLWFLGRGHGARSPAKAPTAAARPESPVAAAEPAPSSKPLPPQQAEEVAATTRMYLAHAPLRTPEVADPDSKANKQILQTMVLKALAQSAHPPPSAQAKH